MVAMSQKKKKGDFYRISVYHFSNAEQEQRLDGYLEKSLLPALHKLHYAHVGIFKPIANDTATDKRIYVFLKGKTLEQLAGIDEQVFQDPAFTSSAAGYLGSAHDNPPFTRIETILLSAFRLAPAMNLPGLTSPKADHVYELRSYEGPTESKYRSKVHMFNEGGEISLFKRLQFNAVFYAEVVSGSRMPNLMYMTSFENMTERDAHWKSFVDDPEWKRLSALPEYQHTVSKADIILMRAVPYSDF